MFAPGRRPAWRLGGKSGTRNTERIRRSAIRQTGLAADIEAHGEIDIVLALYQQAAEKTSDASDLGRPIRAPVGSTRRPLRSVQPRAVSGQRRCVNGAWVMRKKALTDAIVVLERAASRSETAGIWDKLGLP
jgi:hypothetical protein